MPLRKRVRTLTYVVSAFRRTGVVSAFRQTGVVSAFRRTSVASAFRRTGVASAFRRTVRTCRATCLIGALVLLAAMPPEPAVAQTTRAMPNDVEIAQALAKVKADPNVGGTRTIKVPEWRTNGPTPSWAKWIARLFAFLAQSSRPLFWIAVFALAIALLSFFIRSLAARAAREAREQSVTPTHVRDLDIRPESLPADIGGAARQLWDSGQKRAALALLYRGLLSRLAHVHRIPIRDSTTEGDCLTLTQEHLTETRYQYSARLVRVWQRSVYGGADADTSSVYELCDTFAEALDAAAAPSAQMAR